MQERPEIPPPNNTLQAALESLWCFLKPLGKNTKPGTTGISAIKKSMLSEHGPQNLQQQRDANIKKADK